MSAPVVHTLVVSAADSLITSTPYLSQVETLAEDYTSPIPATSIITDCDINSNADLQTSNRGIVVAYMYT